MGEEGVDDEEVVVPGAAAAAATAAVPFSLLKESVVSEETRGTEVSIVGGLGFCFRRNLDILSMARTYEEAAEGDTMTRGAAAVV